MNMAEDSVWDPTKPVWLYEHGEWRRAQEGDSGNLSAATYGEKAYANLPRKVGTKIGENAGLAFGSHPVRG